MLREPGGGGGGGALEELHVVFQRKVCVCDRDFKKDFPVSFESLKS